MAKFNPLTVIYDSIYMYIPLGTKYSNNKMRKIEF